MSAFPATAPRYGEILAARGMPPDQRRNDHTWVRFSRHFCQQYHHSPADARSLPRFLDKLASKRQTAVQQAQAQRAVEYYAMVLLPEARSRCNVTGVAPPAPAPSKEARTARQAVGRRSPPVFT